MNALITVSGESTGLTRWTQQTDGGNGSHTVSKLHHSKDCHLPFWTFCTVCLWRRSAAVWLWSKLVEDPKNVISEADGELWTLTLKSQLGKRPKCTIITPNTQSVKQRSLQPDPDFNSDNLPFFFFFGTISEVQLCLVEMSGLLLTSSLIHSIQYSYYSRKRDDTESNDLSSNNEDHLVVCKQNQLAHLFAILTGKSNRSPAVKQPAWLSSLKQMPPCTRVNVLKHVQRYMQLVQIYFGVHI